jgi:YD repeat-containing protein
MPLRTGQTTYLVNDPAVDTGTRAAYRARNLVSLVSSTRVRAGDATGAVLAQSEVKYDEPGFPLLSYGTVTGWADPQTTVRGNPTTGRVWLDTSGGWLQSHRQYDQCGNVRKAWDAVYDAESRMTQAQDVYQQWSTYTYDADGRRVRRLVANQETWHVYGIGGELLAEYRGGSAPMTPTKEYGYRGGELLVMMSSGDDQRLKRFVTNLYYSALRRDPTPQELADASTQLAAAGAQGQSQLLGKAKQLARALFTQTAYETSPARTDTQYVSDLHYAYMQRAADDSGLGWWVSQLPAKQRSGVCDDFQNRPEFDALVTTLFGSASSGRFTGVEPANYQARQDLSFPQSWNASAYVNNNPLRHVDPDGRGWSEIWQRIKNSFLYEQNVTEMGGSIRGTRSIGCRDGYSPVGSREYHSARDGRPRKCARHYDAL